MKLQHPIISIFGNRFLKIYFHDILLNRAHILRTIFIFKLETFIHNLFYTLRVYVQFNKIC